MKKRVLFVSSSVSLGHVVRDYEIAKELRGQLPGIEIIWLVCEPARSFLLPTGEILHPEIGKWSSVKNILDEQSRVAAQNGRVYSLNWINCIVKFRKLWERNVKVFDEIMKSEEYDLVIGDFAYEIAEAIRDKVIRIKPTFVMIYDVIGVEVMTKNPLEKIIAYKINYEWVEGLKKTNDKIMLRIFIGTLEDVPNNKFGFLLPNRRESVKDKYHFAGYVLSFKPGNFSNKDEIRRKLNYGNDPMIICSVGGTSLGKPLLELLCKAFPLIKERLPSIKMVLVAGPQISPDILLNIHEGISVRDYLPNQFEHFAVCDLAVVQGGSNTTLELVALNKPFIYFPIEGHFEQQLYVASRLERFKAGVKMQFSQTTPELLTEKVVSNIGKKVEYPPIPFDGANNAARIIKQILVE